MSSEPGLPKTERRSRKRIVKRVRRAHDSGDVMAHTRDVSATGIFLYTQSGLVAGCEVELVLILPPELTAGEKCWVCCHAQVLRVESVGKKFGVAANIRRIEVLPEIAI